MKNIVLITSLSVALFGCSSASQTKKEFMFGCTGGFDSPAVKKGCECTYQHMVNKYGSEAQLEAKMKNMNHMESVMRDMAVSAQQCTQ